MLRHGIHPQSRFQRELLYAVPLCNQHSELFPNAELPSGGKHQFASAETAFHAHATLVVNFSKLLPMKFRFVLVLVTFVVVAILATRRPRIVKPPPERGTWTPLPSDR